MGWTGEYVYGTVRYAEEKARVAAIYTWGDKFIQVRPIMLCNVPPELVRCG